MNGEATMIISHEDMQHIVGEWVRHFNERPAPAKWPDNARVADVRQILRNRKRCFEIALRDGVEPPPGSGVNDDESSGIAS